MIATSTTRRAVIRIAVVATICALLLSLLAPAAANAAPPNGVPTAPESQVGETRVITLPDGAFGSNEESTRGFQVRARVIARGIAIADHAAPVAGADQRLVFSKKPLPVKAVDDYAAQATAMLDEIRSKPEGAAFLEQLADVRVPGKGNGLVDITQGARVESDITVLLMPGASVQRQGAVPLFANRSTEYGSASILGLDFDHVLGTWTAVDPRTGARGRPIAIPRTIVLLHELVHSLHAAAGALAIEPVDNRADIYLRHSEGVERRTVSLKTTMEEMYTSGTFADLYTAYKARNPQPAADQRVPNIYENPRMTASVANARTLLNRATNGAERTQRSKALQARRAASAAAFTEDRAVQVLGYTSPRTTYSGNGMHFTDDPAVVRNFREANPEAMSRGTYRVWVGILARGVSWSQVTAADYADPLASSRLLAPGVVPEAFAAEMRAPATATRADFDLRSFNVPSPLSESPESSDDSSESSEELPEPPVDYCVFCSSSQGASAVSDADAEAFRGEVAAQARSSSLAAGSSEDVVNRAVEHAATDGQTMAESLDLSDVPGGSTEGVMESAPRVGVTVPRMGGFSEVAEELSTRLSGLANAPLAIGGLISAFKDDASDLAKAAAAFGLASLAVEYLGPAAISLQALALLTSWRPGDAVVYKALWGALLGASGYVFPPVAAATLTIMSTWEWAESAGELNDGLTLDQRVAEAYQFPSQLLMRRIADSIGETQGEATALAVKQEMFRSAYLQSRIDMEALAGGFAGDGEEPIWVKTAKAEIQQTTLEQLSTISSLGFNETRGVFDKAVAEVNTGATYVHFRDAWVHEVWDAKRGEEVRKGYLAACSFSLIGYVACAAALNERPATSFVTQTDTSGMATSTSLPFDPAAFYGGTTRASDLMFPAYRDVVEPVLFVGNDTNDPRMPAFNTTLSGYKVPRVKMADTIAHIDKVAVGTDVPWRITSPIVSKTGAVTEQKITPFTAITGTGVPGQFFEIKDSSQVKICSGQVGVLGMWRCDSERLIERPTSAADIRLTFLRIRADDPDRIPNGAFELFTSPHADGPLTATGQRMAWIADMPAIPNPLMLTGFTNTGRTITGKVSLESGPLVPGASVRIVSKNPAVVQLTGEGDTFSPTVTTSDDGTFTVTADAGARQGLAQLVITLGEKKNISEVILSARPSEPIPPTDLTTIAGNALQITEVSAHTIRGVTSVRHDVKIRVPGHAGEFADVTANPNTGEFSFTITTPLTVGTQVTVTSQDRTGTDKSLTRTLTYAPPFTSPFYATPNRTISAGIAVHAAPGTTLTTVDPVGNEHTCTTGSNSSCIMDNVNAPSTFTLINTTTGQRRPYSLDRTNTVITPQ